MTQQYVHKFNSILMSCIKNKAVKQLVFFKSMLSHANNYFNHVLTR